MHFCEKKGWIFGVFCSLALLLGQGWAGESGVGVAPVVIGNQSAFPRPDGTYAVYNVPTGFNRYTISEKNLISTTLFEYSAISSSGFDGIETAKFHLTPLAFTTAPSDWRPFQIREARLTAEMNAPNVAFGYPLPFQVRRIH